jgi:predicted phage terminase large subunit-like protein
VGFHPRRPFVASFLEDNPYLDQRSYDEGLQQLDPVTREQLRRGNWGISPDSRFKRQWAKYYSRRGDYFVLGPDGRGHEHHITSLQRIFSTVDPAGSSRESPGSTQIWRQAPSYTVISTWGLTLDFHLLWLDMVRFRKEIPDIVDALRHTYRKWRPAYMTIEGNGLGRGICQYAIRSGLPVKVVSKLSDKLVNATDAMVRMKEGRIWLPEEAGWLETCEDELFTWTGHPHAESDDIIDTLADASREVSWEASGLEIATDPVIGNLTVDDLPMVYTSPQLLQQGTGYDPYQF